MPFLDHLEELRWRILWSLLAIAVGAVIGWFLVTRFDVLGLLIEPMRPLLENGKLAYLSPADPFIVTLKLTLTTGIILASPIIIYQVWIFLSPALLPDEKRAIVPALYFGLLLFLAGMALAYFVALPVMFQFFAQFQQASLEQNITIGPYMAVVVRTLLGFGLVFELPVVMLVLAAVGVVDTNMLRKGRRWAIVIITVVASFITPGDVVILTVFLMVPLLLLYELGIVLARVVERRREQRLMELRDEEQPEQWTGA
ncbi:MAG: twin-arginine translocase subunit TatC [Gemmatimonadetes bacterium]|nr:twin-arginine translocase subunit TatC [Gemmatimonadota bacterium]NIQ54768.1 twin-arginine translocase subunit TatC [Gemmatimonadota bacterium]NIU74977.1 twin-arginine translocase subunit TatC [Gammaproteobacteria bacterium]NIX44850.1 twin-arginine translocase subunit TatC [Gemmatimonadota bacterium]NIY09088.1 twin-arginine translocase subunit TatC [Gemmatimonadota bacterium]